MLRPLYGGATTRRQASSQRNMGMMGNPGKPGKLRRISREPVFSQSKKPLTELEKTVAQTLKEKEVPNVPKGLIKDIAAAITSTIDGDDLIRGITDRSNAAWALFRDLARADFKHDFGERESTRDLIMKSDENRFFDIAKQVSKKGSVFLRSRFNNEYVGKTLYALFGNSIDMILPPVPSGVKPKLDFYDEVGLLLNRLGIDFEKIKTTAMNTDEGVEWKEPFQTGGITRNYTLRSANYRLGPRGSADYKTNQNITTIFNKITGGKNKFVLIVDASGGLPLSELLNSNLGPDPIPESKFYIIENIENTSDSATKLSSGLKKRGDGPFPSVFFLRDTANTVVYPLWKLNAKDPKSNVFSSMKIILNRITDDEVEADLIIVDSLGSTIQAINIGDVSNSSNVKNATLRALANFMENGIVPETLVYTLIKRMGDWCQALSMLDLDRAYDILNTDRSSSGVNTTLRDMMVDSEIGVVTNDRILLGVCILLGLNVFYTTAMDVAKVIYFKNDNDVPPGDALLARTESIFSSLPKNTPVPYDFLLNVNNRVERVTSEQDIAEYIFRLKCLLSNIGKLRNEYDTYTSQITNNSAIYASTNSSPIEKFNAANALVSLYAKIDIDNKHNFNLFQSIDNGVYDDSEPDRIRIDSLKRKLQMGGRIMKSVEVTEAKNILSGIRDDVLQVLGKKSPQLNMILNGLLNVDRFMLGEDDRRKVNYDELLSVLPAIRIAIPSVQGGGKRQRGGAEIADIHKALQIRPIRLLPNGVTELTSTVNIYGNNDNYIDSKLRSYTISDQYIVTQDDLPTFDAFFNLPEVDLQNQDVQYICLKYLLLQLDICRNELNNIEQGKTVCIRRNVSESDKCIDLTDTQKMQLEEDEKNNITGEFIREKEELEPGSIEYELFMDYAGRVALIVNIVQSNSIVDGAKTLYTDITSHESEADNYNPDALNETQDVVAELIQRINTFVPASSPEEIEQTVEIENAASKTPYFAIGLFRETLAQRLNTQVNLKRAPVDEWVSLGEAIEEGIQEALVGKVYSGQAVEQQSDVWNEVRNSMLASVGEWISVHRPNRATDENLIQMVTTWIDNIITQNVPSEKAAFDEYVAAAFPSPSNAAQELELPPLENTAVGGGDGDLPVGTRGGLRTVRSLYRNARKTAARDVDGTSNDEGLRKRSGPRTTARVRKSSRSTRRRR